MMIQMRARIHFFFVMFFRLPMIHQVWNSPLICKKAWPKKTKRIREAIYPVVFHGKSKRMWQSCLIYKNQLIFLYFSQNSERIFLKNWFVLTRQKVLSDLENVRLQKFPLTIFFLEIFFRNFFRDFFEQEASEPPDQSCLTFSLFQSSLSNLAFLWIVNCITNQYY